MKSISTNYLNNRTVVQRTESQQENPVRRSVLSFVSEANNISEVEQLEKERLRIKNQICIEFESECPKLYEEFINSKNIEERRDIIDSNPFLLKIRDEALKEFRLLSKEILPLEEVKHTDNDGLLFLNDIKDKDILIQYDTSDMEVKLEKLTELKKKRPSSCDYKFIKSIQNEV